MRKIRFETFIKAIEKNGWPQIRNSYWEDENGSVDDDDPAPAKESVKGACAIGQAALNLNSKYPQSWEINVVSDDNIEHIPDEVVDFVIELNDKKGLTLEQIGQELRKRYSKSLNVLVYI